jgi:hypothetical protein
LTRSFCDVSRIFLTALSNWVLYATVTITPAHQEKHPPPFV